MTERQYRLAKGKNEKSNEITNVSTTWPRIVKVFTQHEVSNSKEGEYLVGGHFKGNIRQESEIVGRSLLTIDIDKGAKSIEGLEFDLAMGISCAFCAYSTFRHQLDAPRVRVIVPLSRDVTPAEYRSLSRDFVAALGIEVDPCSFAPNQAMFYPKCPDLTMAWSYHQDGEPYAVPEHVASYSRDDDDDLSIAIAKEPLDLTASQVNGYLAAYPAQGKEYDEWFKVGAAIHHQTRGEGFELWREWSNKSDKHDEKLMLKKWGSIGRDRSRPVTFASIIALVRSNGGESIAPEHKAVLFDTLCVKASTISSHDEYTAFKSEIRAMPYELLGKDERAMIASEMVDAYGKKNGLTKSEIKRELQEPEKRKRLGRADDAPDWVAPWVYIEALCEFANTDLNYTIKREAFNAKYGREPDVVSAECMASELALNTYTIPVLVDVIYVPLVGTVFEWEGKQMLNAYKISGIPACEVVDSDGQNVIDMFMAHMQMLFPDTEERTIIMDFIAHTIKRPGDKINWALLIHGPEGVGKSYISSVVSLMLGENVRALTSSAIAGRFTGWATGAVLNVIEEIHISGESSYEMMDKMKPFISNDVVQIEEKGRDHRTVPNMTNYIAFTNRKDAVPIGEGDRRYTVIKAAIESEAHLFEIMGGRAKSEIYFTKLFEGSKRRADAIHRHFLDWQISDSFTPKGRAPMTDAKRNMIDLCRSPARMMVEDAIESNRSNIINDRILDVTWLNKLLVMEGLPDEFPKNRLMSKVLLEMGYEPVEGKRVKIAKTSTCHYIWHKPDAVGSDDAKCEVKATHDDPEHVPF
jgi:hypothetical protein